MQFRLMPNRFIVDTGIMSALKNLNHYTLRSKPLLTGALMETLVAAHLCPEREFAATPDTMYHWRQKSGERELDFLLQTQDRDLIGIEVTANSRPSKKNADHLRWFRKRGRSCFIAGVVLHTGTEFDEPYDQVFSVPISTLWADNGAPIQQVHS